MTSALVIEQATNVRTNRFNAALDKFLELIDDKATSENFQMAIPDLKPKVLESARKRIVDELKDAIKDEKKKLMQTYELEEKLEDLEVLVQEAETRKQNANEHYDVWRSNLDLSTTLYSRSIKSQQESIVDLERELKDLEEENQGLTSSLQQSMSKEESLRLEACGVLDCLEQSIAALNSSSEDDGLQRELIDRLLQDLGPRSIATMSVASS